MSSLVDPWRGRTLRQTEQHRRRTLVPERSRACQRRLGTYITVSFPVRAGQLSNAIARAPIGSTYPTTTRLRFAS